MPELNVDILKPKMDDKTFRGTAGQNREVLVRVVVDGASNNVKVKAGTGQSVGTTVPSIALAKEGNTHCWRGWIPVNYAAFFVRALAVQGTNDAYDHDGPITDDGS